MEKVEIVNADENSVEEATKIIATVFQQEAINRYMHDFSKPKVNEALDQAAFLKAKLLLEAGHDILLARTHEKVVGGLVLRKDIKIPLRKTIRVYFPQILRPLVYVLLSLHLRKLLSAISLFKMPDSVNKPYYTLEAVGVNADHQGQGIGKRLITAAHKRVKNNPDVAGIYLITADEKNRQIYEHLGYETLAARAGKEITVYHMFRANTG